MCSSLKVSISFRLMVLSEGVSERHSDGNTLCAVGEDGAATSGPGFAERVPSCRRA